MDNRSRAGFVRSLAGSLLAMAVVVPTAAWTLAVLGWTTPRNAALLPGAGLVLGVAAVVVADRRALGAAAAAALGLAGFAVATALAAGAVPDVFFDSQLYHLPASFALRDGWSPLLEPDACRWRAAYCVPHPGIDHYPKAAWALSASMYAWTGSFEAGKSVQLWTLLAAWLATGLLLRDGCGLGRGSALLFSTLFALNPVALKQAASAYVDGWLASATLLFAVLLLDFVLVGRRRSLVLAALALPLLVNLKLTGLLYGGVAALSVLAVAWTTRRDAVGPMLRVLAPAACAAVLLLGFHPYVTNWMQKGNPFHPAFAPERPSILRRMAAPEFIERDRFSRFAVAQVSRSSAEDHRRPEWIVPFGAWRVTPEVDDRFSGFGEPFAAVWILAAVALVRSRSRTAGVLLAGLAVSVFASEAGWWARLAPQVWWVGPLAALGCWPRRADRPLAVAIVALLAWTVVATSGVVLANALENRARLESVFAGLEGRRGVVVPDPDGGVVTRGFVLTLRRRLRDAGYPTAVSRAPAGPCAAEFRFVNASLCARPAEPSPARR